MGKQIGVMELREMDIREISLVDNPAIRRRFLVMKRDGKEALFEIKEGGLINMLEALQKFAKDEEISQLACFASAPQEEILEVEKANGYPAGTMSNLKQLIDNLLDTLQKAGYAYPKPHGFEKAYYQYPAKIDEADPEKQERVAVKIEEEKSGAKLAKERLAQLRNAFELIQKILKDIDPEFDKARETEKQNVGAAVSIIRDVLKKELPEDVADSLKTVLGALGVSGYEYPAPKSKDAGTREDDGKIQELLDGIGEVKKSLESVDEKFGKVDERVGKLEEVRGISKADPNNKDGDDEKEERSTFYKVVIE